MSYDQKSKQNGVENYNIDVYVLFIPAAHAPVLLGKTNGSTYVAANTNLTLTVYVSADPEPVATWQLDGGDLTTTTSMLCNVVK